MHLPPLNELIRSGRNRLGWTQGYLAGQTRTTQKPKGRWVTYISQIERGEKIPSDEVCLLLAQLLDLDSLDLLLAAQEARTPVDHARELIRNARRLCRGDQAHPPPTSVAGELDSIVQACYASAHRQRLLELIAHLADLDQAQQHLLINFVTALTADRESAAGDG